MSDWKDEYDRMKRKLLLRRQQQQFESVASLETSKLEHHHWTEYDVRSAFDPRKVAASSASQRPSQRRGGGGGGIGGGGIGGGGMGGGTPTSISAEPAHEGQRAIPTAANVVRRQVRGLVGRVTRTFEAGSRRTWWSTQLLSLVPVITVIKTYKREFVLRDVLAGLSVGISSIPMGMSYSLLAGLPPGHGLYNNLFFPLIYMIFATSREVCVGTSAVEAMLSAQAVSSVVGWDASEDERLNASVTLSLFVGLFLITYRILGLGIVASFLADPVLSGFSTGAALVIGTSQLKHIFGFSVPRVSTFRTWIYLLANLNQTNIASLLIGICGIGLLWLSQWSNKKWCPRCPLPGALVLLVIFTAGTYFLNANMPPFSVKIIGNIPRGLAPALLPCKINNLGYLTFQALCYSVIYLVVHISIAKALAQQSSYTLNVSQEFLALGISCVFGSFFQCFPIATSVSRSSIARLVGACTILYNVVNCLVVLLAITAITPALYYLPMASLASVVIFGVIFMLDFREAFRLAKLFSVDFVLWLSSFLITITWGPMEGVICSVAFSLVWLLKKAAFPRTVILGRLPGSRVYRNVERFPMAEEIPQCKIIRFDASLNFANADAFAGNVLALIDRKVDKEGSLERIDRDGSTDNEKDIVKVVIVDASSINDVDVTAVRMLKSLALTLAGSGVVMLFANWKGPMRDFLDRVGFYQVVKTSHCFLSLEDAVQWAEAFHLNLYGELPPPPESTPTVAASGPPVVATTVGVRSTSTLTSTTSGRPTDEEDEAQGSTQQSSNQQFNGSNSTRSDSGDLLQRAPSVTFRSVVETTGEVDRAWTIVVQQPGALGEVTTAPAPP